MSPSRQPTSPSGPTSSASRPPVEAPDAIGSVPVALFVISVATLLAYSNTFYASFHLDDIGVIVQNQSLRDLRSQWPPSGSRWLGDLSFALNYQVGGLGVFGYHLTNLLIHVCNGLLVFWFTAITLRTPALRRAEAGPLVRSYLPLTAALLFAVHPLATQAVTYIVQRFASLATLFFLLSLVLYAKARLLLEEDGPARPRVALLWFLSVVAAAGAMKTKEISFTLPFVAAGTELLFFRSRRRLLQLLLLVPLAATTLLILLQPALGQMLAEAGIPRSTYLLTQSRVVVTYLRLLVLPVQQNFDYDFALSHSLAEPAVLFALAVLLAVATSAVYLLLRALETGRAAGLLVFFGIAWIFVTLSVESSIFPIKDVIFEHRMYLPSVGAAVAGGTALLWAVERLRLRGSLRLQCAAALLITAGPLGVATYLRNAVWKDDLSLWSDVVRKSPQKARPHHFLGIAHFDRGQMKEAVGEFLIALRIRPWYPEALTNLGNTYWAMGQVDDALREFRRAVLLAPEQAMAHNNLGAAYEVKGQLDDAEREYREAIRLAPGQAEAGGNLLRLQAKKGRAATPVQGWPP